MRIYYDELFPEFKKKIDKLAETANHLFQDQHKSSEWRAVVPKEYETRVIEGAWVPLRPEIAVFSLDYSNGEPKYVFSYVEK